MTHSTLNKTIFVTAMVAVFWTFVFISVVTTRDAMALAQTISATSTSR